MAKRTKEDALKTRQLLIDTAIITFSQQGFASTSLDDIARAAHVTRGAIYWHFANKAELFNAIWDEQLPVREKIASKIRLHPDASAETILRESLIEGLRLIAQEPLEQALVEILYHKCEFTKELTAEIEIRERLLFNHDNVALMLKRCLHENPAFMNNDIELAIIIIQAYLSGIVKNWLMTDKSFDLDKLAPSLVDGLLASLRMTPSASGNPHPFASSPAPASSISP
ncbi:TetR family transcriptional regulator [Enterobacter sp. ENT03]|uniref:TetR family transcriptional regulator n=1 Tax=Enterobacter sp. ENT03 TaxID=2854780 RepID=UPI001C4723D1|nr:TetR family transcriptional regulator [Enterobacter sp. ENT03]MBV7405096.1 TetR family transcriptional regulator [Enterobacter sp. ENT03]